MSLITTSSLPMALNPDKLIQIFYKYPLEFIPITHDQAIKGYISKENTFRQSNTQDFFTRDLVLSVTHLLVKMDEEKFFEELDQHGEDLPEIPTIISKNFTVRLIPRSEFNAIFRPVEELPAGDFKTILDEMTLPVLIFNSRHQLIYKNKKSRRLLRAFQLSLASRSTRFEDYLPSDFFNLLDEPNSQRIYHLDAGTGEKPFDYKVTKIELPKGPISMTVFLPTGDDRL